MKKISRKKAIKKLAEAQADTFASDMTTSDAYTLLVEGMPGLNKLTNAELTEELKSSFNEEYEVTG